MRNCVLDRRRLRDQGGDAPLPDAFGNRGALPPFSSPCAVMSFEEQPRHADRRDRWSPLSSKAFDPKPTHPRSHAAGARRADEAVDAGLPAAPSFPGAVLATWARRLAILSNIGWPGPRLRFPRPCGARYGPEWPGLDERRGGHEAELGPQRAAAHPSSRATAISGITITVLLPSALATSARPSAGTARRAFDDGAAGRSDAARFRIAHDPQRGAVLHRSAGIGELALAP